MSFSLVGLEADRAQELLAHFAAIVDSSDDAILSKDLNGIIRSWNISAQKIFGYTAEEMIGKSVTLLIPEGHLDEEPHILNRIKRGERIDHYETVRKRKDGSLVNISLTISPIKDAKGVIIGASKIARDITAQKQSEELGLLYAAIVQSSDDAIISKDLNGIIRSWNKGAEEIFGYKAWEMIGKPITTLIPAGYINEEPEILGRIRRGEKVDHYQTKRQRKDGTLVSLSLTVSPIKNRAGTVIGASKIARDITKQKAAEHALQQAKDDLAALNRDLEDRVRERTQALQTAVSQMEEFSYSVSHDLRSPVRAMKAYAQAALEDYGDRLDDVGRDYLHRIVRNSVRMDKLIIDVLIYSRLARSEVKTHPIAIAPLLHDIIQLYPDMQPPRAEIVLQEPWVG
jgi:PAS domain S-box-containing protein